MFEEKKSLKKIIIKLSKNWGIKNSTIYHILKRKKKKSIGEEKEVGEKVRLEL